MITQELVKNMFKYYRGQLIRKTTVSWKSNAGDIAGSYDAYGYIIICIKGKHYKAHRLVWLYHRGYLPRELDHKDGIRDNNRMGNLRECNPGQNSMNAKPQCGCTSNFKGVSWHKATGKWRCRITHNKIMHTLGYFINEYEAAYAYDSAARRLHGRFSYTNF